MRGYDLIQLANSPRHLCATGHRKRRKRRDRVIVETYNYDYSLASTCSEQSSNMSTPQLSQRCGCQTVVSKLTRRTTSKVLVLTYQWYTNRYYDGYKTGLSTNLVVPCCPSVCSMQQSAVAMYAPHLLRPLSGTSCVLPPVHKTGLKHGYDTLPHHGKACFVINRTK